MSNLFPASAQSRSWKNVSWNLFGGLWTGVLIVVSTPYFVRRLGLGGYGVLGLWLMMQVMMGLLDAGMGATLVKEFAGASEDVEGGEYKRELLRTLECVYWGISISFALGLILASGVFTTHWLKIVDLPVDHVRNAIRLMALTLGSQFPYVLYSNGIAGLQEHRRMNIITLLGNTFRYGCGVCVLWWRVDLVLFFAVQTVVSVIQTMAARQVLLGMISAPEMKTPRFNPGLIRKIWHFSVGMGFTAVFGVLLSNVDRIALSKLLNTVELGKYSVAFTATGLLQFGIQPFYRAFFPRYSELVALGARGRLRDEYYRSCQIMASVILPMAILAGLFAPQLFQAWLGNKDGVVIEVFRCLLVGLTGAGLMWLPAAFQQAHGWTRLHVSMIIGALLLGAPIMVWAIKAYGLVGATLVWVLYGVSSVTVELWLMHRRLLVGELVIWVRTVIMPPIMASLPVALLFWYLMPKGLHRAGGFFWTAMTGAFMMAATLGLLLILRMGIGAGRNSNLTDQAP